VASQKFATDYREPLDTAKSARQLTSLAANLDDMSARVSQLIESQKEMTAALSHEMRTPLARVRFAMAVLEGEVDKSLHVQLRAVNTDVQQIDDLISDMLDYARLDHPGLRMDCQEVALEPWLRQVTAACPPHEKKLEYVRDGGIETAWMEPRLMELALNNLVVNALRYARNQVRIEITRDHDLNRLVVEDDGDGIPEADRAAIFRAFTRLDTSRNRETGGFGLGLAIVARIASLHRGRVIAGSSRSLGGARLALEWPVAI
jgi:signal transduction histidine kinase